MKRATRKAAVIRRIPPMPGRKTAVELGVYDVPAHVNVDEDCWPLAVGLIVADGQRVPPNKATKHGRVTAINGRVVTVTWRNGTVQEVQAEPHKTVNSHGPTTDHVAWGLFVVRPHTERAQRLMYGRNGVCSPTPAAEAPDGARQGHTTNQRKRGSMTNQRKSMTTRPSRKRAGSVTRAQLWESVREAYDHNNDMHDAIVATNNDERRKQIRRARTAEREYRQLRERYEGRYGEWFPTERARQQRIAVQEWEREVQAPARAVRESQSDSARSNIAPFVDRIQAELDERLGEQARLELVQALLLVPDAATGVQVHYRHGGEKVVLHQTRPDGMTPVKG